METQNWYSVQEFAPGTFQITEAGRYNTFLFVGKDRALAIDGGLGVANLRKLHESITKLPIDFILTHTHWDHLGGAHLWDKVGVHPLGKGQLANDHSAAAQRFIQGWKQSLPPGFDPKAYTIKPITFGWTLKEGDTFEVGGRRFRVYDTPGHSPDSISLLEEREGVLISGDLVKPLDYLFLQVPTAVLRDYAPSLRKLEKIAKEVKWICSGHTPPFNDASIIGEMTRFMEEIEAGKHEKAKKRFTPPGWGELDEYEAKRFKVWIGDHARK